MPWTYECIWILLRYYVVTDRVGRQLRSLSTKKDRIWIKDRKDIK